MATSATTRRIQATLKNSFGLARLRPGQREVIDRVLASQHTLAIMPTGAGKSLCYQLPALLSQGRTLVVSPLIALMKDQVESLQALGIAAVQLNSALDSAEARFAHEAAVDGSARIVMTTPEKLNEPGFLEALSRHPTSLLVVDEAHCISQWGHDFRPAFLDIAAARSALGKPAILALTATAGDEVARDICEQLGIPRSGTINTGIYRPNLELQVEQVGREQDKLERAIAYVKATEGSGLVYCATVKAAKAVHDALHAKGEPAGLYHGKLAAGARHAAQEAFMDGSVRVMVATNAFGLGIDKADIRFVLHYQLPASLEAYYQEAGRAGRDGQPAQCRLLFLRSDKSVQQFFMAGRYPSDEDAAALYGALQDPPPAGEAWSLALLQGRLARPRSKLQVALGLLRRHKVVAMATDGAVRLLRKGLQANALRSLMATYRGKREQDRDTLERMVAYAQAGQCRWRLLVEQMAGEAPFTRCQTCDNCRRIAQQEAAQLASQAQAPSAEPIVVPATLFAPGELVKVRRYGRGEVQQASACEVTVAFADGSRRNFQPDFVKRYKNNSKQRPVDAGFAPV